MENFIFVLLAIAIFGYKQYQKSLKNKTLSPANGDNKDNPKSNPIDLINIDKSLDDFINNFFGEKTYNTTDVIESEENDEALDSNISSFEDDDNIVNNESINTNNVENNNPVELTENDKSQFGINQNKGTRSSELSDFDLRKAVIYDAILNPPYIAN